MTRQSILAAVALALATLHAARADWPLAVDGQPRAVIVTADQPTPAASAAAKELSATLNKMTGAAFAVATASTFKPQPGWTTISVGDTPFAAKEGLEGAKLGMEGVRMATRPGWIYLLGRDVGQGGSPAQGTFWAVAQFEEDILGCLWLWPGPTGEVIPRQPTLTVKEALDVSYTPPVIHRRIRNNAARILEEDLKEIGRTQADLRAYGDAGGLWFDRQRVGKSVEMWYTHAYGGWYDKYHKDHPDWFALQPDHSRNQTPPRERLCVSNMGLIEEIARDKIAYLKENPNMLCASISPNDGGRNAFCMCENCRKLDPVDAPPIEYTFYKGPVKTTVPYVSLSDRYVWFYSRIAERVAKELPDRYVGAYAYSIYRTPPVRQKLHDNVIIGLVAFSYMNDDARDKGFEQWQGWRKNAKNLFLRPNAFFVAGGGPVNFARAIAADFKKLQADGLRIVDYDGWVGNWGSQGLSVYVLAKVLWNPQADVESLIRDYVQKGFGPAAGPVGEYFQALEDFTTAIAKARDYNGMKYDSRLLMGKYDDAFLTRMRAILDKARQSAAQDPAVLARIAKLAAGLDYAEALRESILNKKPEKLNAFRKEHALDFTVNVECLRVLR